MFNAFVGSHNFFIIIKNKIIVLYDPMYVDNLLTKLPSVTTMGFEVEFDIISVIIKTQN